MTRERSPTSVKSWAERQQVEWHGDSIPVGRRSHGRLRTGMRQRLTSLVLLVGPSGLMSIKLRQQHRDFIDRIQAGFSNPHFFNTTLCTPQSVSSTSPGLTEVLTRTTAQ